MTGVFMLCAIVGGAVLLFQFVLTIIGLGDTGLDFGDALPDGLDMDLDVDLGDGDLDIGDPHGSTSMFGVLSFRTVVAAITFFGLAGLAAAAASVPVAGQLLIAAVAGVGAMYGVYYMMRSIYRLGQNSTLRVDNTIGRTGTVNVSVPAGNSGMGKVQVKVQGRLEEFAAITHGGHDKLSSGAKVVVTGVVGNSTLEVQPLPEPETASV